MSYVLLPRSRSYSPMMRPSNGPMSAPQRGFTQPPRLKSLVGSSSGPPGACMTPSREMNAAPVSLRIGGFAGRGCFDRRDVDLAHLHHGLERALRLRRIGVGGQVEQDLRRDLPGIAPLVLAPAASAFLAAVLDDGIPVAVG